VALAEARGAKSTRLEYNLVNLLSTLASARKSSALCFAPNNTLRSLKSIYTAGLPSQYPADNSKINLPPTVITRVFIRIVIPTGQ
jgi:hypothetical protein